MGLILANVGSAFIFYLLVPTMAGHAIDAFNATPAQGGALASVFFVGAVAARLLGGYAVEKLGVRRLAVISAVLYLFTTAAYLIAPDWLTMMAVRTLNGACFGFFSTTLSAAVMMIAPPTRRGEASGFFGLSISITIGLGPFVALQLLNGAGGMTAVFAAAVGCAAWSLVMVLLMQRSLPEAIPTTTAKHASKPSLSWRQLIETAALPVGAVAALAAMSYSSILTYLQSHTQNTPMEQAAGFFFGVYAVTVAFTRPPVGRFQDRHGDDPVYIPCLMLQVVAVALVAMATSGQLLLIAAAILAVGFGSISTAGQATAARLVPPHRTGTAVSTFFLMLDVGTGLGPIVLGLVVPTVGFRGVFWIGSGLAAVALLWYLAIARRQPAQV